MRRRATRCPCWEGQQRLACVTQSISTPLGCDGRCAKEAPGDTVREQPQGNRRGRPAAPGVPAASVRRAAAGGRRAAAAAAAATVVATADGRPISQPPPATRSRRHRAAAGRCVTGGQRFPSAHERRVPRRTRRQRQGRRRRQQPRVSLRARTQAGHPEQRWRSQPHAPRRTRCTRASGGNAPTAAAAAPTGVVEASTAVAARAMRWRRALTQRDESGDDDGRRQAPWEGLPAPAGDTAVRSASAPPATAATASASATASVVSPPPSLLLQPPPKPPPLSLLPL